MVPMVDKKLWSVVRASDGDEPTRDGPAKSANLRIGPPSTDPPNGRRFNGRTDGRPVTLF